LEEAAADWRNLDASVRKKLAPAIERLKRIPEQYGKQLGQPLHRCEECAVETIGLFTVSAKPPKQLKLPSSATVPRSMKSR
jgi:hypothetical protein